MKHYILRGHEVVTTDDALEWARWFEIADRRVAHDTVGGASVSTVFIGVDHNFYGDGPPLVFETMVFGGPLDDAQERCSTWAEAEAQHAEMVARVMAMPRERG